ncbi:MAG: hypothetical protein AB7V45_17590 [Candidatus Krumholzibacteriia bacterium]
MVPLAAAMAALLVPPLPLPAQAAATVTLPAAAPARRTVALEEVWRLGADDDGVLIGLVASGVLDRDGNVLLADRQLAHVLVVSPQGEVIATLGREGDGPGELRDLQSVFIAGDRVGLVQGFPGKVVYVDRDGVPAGGFTLGGGEAGGHYSIRALRSIGNALVGHTDRSSIDVDADEARTRATLSVLDFDGVSGTELIAHEVSRGIMTIVLDEAAEWAEFATWAVGPGGVVATVAERDAWAIRERSLAGELLRTLRRPYEPRMRNGEEMAEAAARIHVAVATGRSTMERKALDSDPAIVDLQYAADGRLFVTTSRNAARRLAEGVAGRFDVITPAGEFREELTVTFPGHDPQQDLLVFLDGTRFLILQNYEDAEKAIHAAFLPEEEQGDLSAAEPLEVVLVRMSAR